MDNRTIRHKVRHLRTRLCIIQKSAMEKMYVTKCCFEHPSVQTEIGEALLIDIIIDGYLNLLNQPANIESEVTLTSDIPHEIY